MNFAAKVRTCLSLQSEAEEAARFYVSLLPDSEIEQIVRPGPDGPVLVVEFRLGGAPFMTLNGIAEPVSTQMHSISVLTEDQAETDDLWAKLTEGGEARQCGWLVDRFGMHWQIVPKALPQLLSQGGPAAGRVQAAMMAMGKIDIAELERAAAE
ncbi:VOC family protein [Algimonas porphyrae]|uniref:VOC family protein n=1 Tax=Algimonas porphyrae TaxID=1128113 RepID=A0ABQ5V1E9_9PROT|nr:VOC family protein [Algimonas porphyrae]GLQ21271.1 VOC family protein [Algimonas porphyrae]